MDASRTGDAIVVAAPAAPWARFDRLASNLFLAMAVLGGVAALVVISLGSTASIDPPWLADVAGRPLLIAVALVVIAVDVAGACVLSIALDRGVSWARPSAVNVLFVASGAGVVQTILDLAAGQLMLPILALLAIWVLSSRPGPASALRGRDRRISAGFTLAAVVMALPTVVPLSALGREGSPFVADPQALELSIVATCPESAARGPLMVQASWRWGARDVLPLMPDALEVAWPGESGLDAGAPTLPDGVALGADTSAARVLTGAGAGDELPRFDAYGERSITVGIDPRGPSGGSGTIAIPFRVEARDEGFDTNLVARFAHGTAWTRAEATSCILAAAPAP